ncbi:hypothetical protein DHW03_12705 [Pedobacter yonginense]|uniref:ATPase n=1 Tax=Pedobacter yonginense TaxID=651869 RepID=A0A317EQA6_9SPHI|nr:hypothetical protein DHW03_12705 [Pedobacter yonginense]
MYRVALKLEGETTIKREFGNLLQAADNYPKYVTTNSEFNGNSYRGIKPIYVRDFLMWEQ